MRKLFQALIFIVGGALFSGAVSAAPTLLYQFQLNQLGCISEYDPCSIGYDQLNDMTIGLTSTAVDNGVASLTISSDFFGGLTEFSNSGFSSLSLAFFPWPVTTVSLDPNSYGSFGPGLTLEASLAVGALLTGSLYVNDTNSEIVMGSSKAFASDWLGPLGNPDDLFDPMNLQEWTGFIRSDALASFILPFRGEWRLVGEVSEPSTWALVLVALAATVWVARRRMRPTSRLLRLRG